MACLKKLKTDFLTTPDAGGVWTYTGPNVITVLITGLGSTVINPGDIIDPGNDDPELDFDTLIGITCGSTYNPFFTYTVTSGSCTDTEVVPLALECPPDAGTGDVSITLCEGDSPIVLFAQLLGTPDTTGVWSGTLLGNPGYNAQGGGPTDDDFDPGVSSVIAGLTAIYTVSSTSTDCPCPDAVRTITVDVVADPDAGTGATASICV